MRLARSLSIAIAAVLVTPVAPLAGGDHAHAPPAATAAPPAAKEACAHGVKRSLCARCNPKLAAVFKAKGDWCAEHERPESQCSLCHPDLAKKGVK